MERKLIQRRRLLTYTGLGILGMSMAAIASQFSSNQPNQPISNVSNLGSSNRTNVASTLPDGGTHLPDFQGISQWLNSDPLTTKDLQGSPVLIQFWTFACINCQRTLPYITKWHQKYAAQGLKVVGIHTPEFAFERDLNNIKQALQKHGINYAVPLDNEFKTWRAYSNEYWPHLFLADRQGIIRYDRIGEGAYEETESMIQKLLG